MFVRRCGLVLGPFLGRLGIQVQAYLSTVFVVVRPQGVRREQQACSVQPPCGTGAGDEGALSRRRRGRVRRVAVGPLGAGYQGIVFYTKGTAKACTR